MSTEIVTIAGVPSIMINGQAVAVPNYAVGQEVENDFGRAGGLPTISPFTTSTFKIRIQDQDKVVPAPLRVVILGITPKGTANNRAYYKEQYVDGQVAAPDCSSSNGIIPDEGDLVGTPGWPTTCASCPMSAFGSAPGERKGQACSQGKTIFVVPENTLDGPIYQVRVAPTSLKSVASYGADLARMGTPMSVAVTNLGLIPETESQKTYPILRLELAGFLDPASAAKSQARAKSSELANLVVDPSMAQVPAAQPSIDPAVAQAELIAKMAAEQVAAQAVASQAEVATGFEAPAAAAVVQPVIDPAVAQAELVAKMVAEQVAAAQAAAQVAAQPVAAPAATQAEIVAKMVAEQVAAALASAPTPTEVQPIVEPSTTVAAEPTTTTAVQPDNGLGVDSAGQPWNAALHSSGQTKIKDGTWKKKKGAAGQAVPEVTANAAPTAAEKDAEAIRQAELNAAGQTTTSGNDVELDDVLNSWG